MSQSTSVARREETATVPFVQTTPIGKMLLSDEARGQIAALVPHGVNYEHVLLEVHRATVKNPDILKCTPASIIDAVGTAVQTGLEIGRTIHLVPVSGKLQAWNDYKGDVELVLWSGAACYVDAQPVYANDKFRPSLGSEPKIEHIPALNNRGPLIGAYCVAWLNRAGTLKKIAWLPLEDIEKIRKNSRSWNPSKVRECPAWYAIKTVVHLNMKMLPKNKRLATVLRMVEAREAAELGEEAALPATRNPLEGAPSFSDMEDADAEVISSTQVEQPTSEAPTPVAPESEGEEVVEEEMTIETALAMPLPGGPKAWGGKGGTPLGQLSAKMIPSIRSWIDNKITEAEAEPDGEAPPIHYRLRNACDVILAARKAEAEKDQETLDLGAEMPAAPVNDSALSPGKIEDALDVQRPVPEPPSAPAPTKSLRELAAGAAVLLRDPKFTPDERANYKAKFDKADTPELMQALVTELESFLKVPF